MRERKSGEMNELAVMGKERMKGRESKVIDGRGGRRKGE